MTMHLGARTVLHVLFFIKKYTPNPDARAASSMSGPALVLCPHTILVATFASGPSGCFNFPYQAFPACLHLVSTACGIYNLFLNP